MSESRWTERGDLLRARRVVVKIGSRLLAEDPDGRIAALAADAAALRERGVSVCIVTSGAIALGVRQLGLAERPRTMPELQACAAVGQGHLMQRWERALAGVGLLSGQVLLTHDDVASRGRYLNARHALAALWRLGVVPVINENDTVSVDEIRFGDNDRLAALVTSLVEAEVLVILTDVDGLYDRDPADGGQLMHEVRDIDVEARPVAGGAGSAVGTGGMLSKVEAAAMAGRFGVVTLVASGRRARPLASLLEGEPAGTVFWPSSDRLAARKRWIAFALHAAGTVRVDDGARRALINGKSSLLPSGVTNVEGTFESGDAVMVIDGQGQELARGLVGFDADELRRIAGHHTSELEALLGYRAVHEVIHKDDLALLVDVPK